MLTISVDSRAVQAKLGDIKAKLGSVLAEAMNHTANAMRLEINREIMRSFDRPTPFTQKALYVTKARPTKLETKVWFRSLETKSAANTDRHYLVSQVFGDHRRAKQFEALLLKKGVLPSGYWAVPGAGAQLDAYGNMRPGQITQIIAWFESFDEVGFTSNMTAETRGKRLRGTKRKRGWGFFVSNGKDRRTAHLPWGVYRKTYTHWGWEIRPILLFVKRPKYRKRLKFFEAGNRAMTATFDRALDKAWRERVGG